MNVIYLTLLIIKNRIQMISKFLIKTFCFLILFNINYAKAQDCINDSIKAFLFLGVFKDNTNIDYHNSIETITNIQELYKIFNYTCTEKKSISVSPSNHFADRDRYYVQLYKMKMEYSNWIPVYYVLSIDKTTNIQFSTPHTLWLRISGFAECDLKIFFDYLRKQGVSKKELTEMVKKWNESDALFQELDWECLLKGYFKDKTNSECFKSNLYIHTYAKYHIRRNDIYSVFSKMPLSGILY